MTPAGVLLDLDGTLADTLPDLAGALDRALAELGVGAVPAAVLRPHASAGSAAMAAAALDHAGGDPRRREALRARFLEHYAAGGYARTRVFDGLPDVLAALERRGVPVGVATNKPAAFTAPLLEAVGVRGRLACVVCAGGDVAPKPRPDALLRAAGELGRAPDRCVYVGDARSDVEAARAAGMAALVAAWGYLDGAGDPARWGADAVLASPADLLRWLEPRPR